MEAQPTSTNETPPPAAEPTNGAIVDRREVSPPPQRLLSGPLLGALILIGLGLLLLIGNFVSLGGGAFFLGLGLAFLIARIVTRQCGLAVPAGILLGFGAYLALTETRAVPQGTDSGGWFFICLGLGFVAVYLIGLRPGVIWPFFPAGILLGFGVSLLGLIDGWPLAQWAGLALYWPIVLVVVGLWLLIRGRLPVAVRRPIATVGILALVLYGTLAIAATGAAAGWRNFGGLPIFWAPYSSTVNLSASIRSGNTLRIDNPAGRTTVQVGSGSEVRVTATKHYWATQQEPQVRLGHGRDRVRLQAAGPLRGVGVGGEPLDNALGGGDQLRVGRGGGGHSVMLPSKGWIRSMQVRAHYLRSV